MAIPCAYHTQLKRFCFTLYLC